MRVVPWGGGAVGGGRRVHGRPVTARACTHPQPHTVTQSYMPPSPCPLCRQLLFPVPTCAVVVQQHLELAAVGLQVAEQRDEGIVHQTHTRRIPPVAEPVPPPALPMFQMRGRAGVGQGGIGAVVWRWARLWGHGGTRVGSRFMGPQGLCQSNDDVFYLCVWRCLCMHPSLHKVRWVP